MIEIKDRIVTVDEILQFVENCNGTGNDEDCFSCIFSKECYLYYTGDEEEE